MDGGCMCSMGGGAPKGKKQQKKETTVYKGGNYVIYNGPRGGKYINTNGKKVYLKK